MLTEKQWKQVADLWLSNDYSPVDIMQETSITLDEIEVAIRCIDYAHDLARKVMLEKVKVALDLA